MTEFEIYYEKFEKLQGFIINDLHKSSVLATANLLVALGTASYIEMLGSFYYTKLENNRKERSKTSKKPKGLDLRYHFVFNNLFPHQYKKILKELQSITERKGYDAIRNGLMHEYLIKTYSRNKKKKITLHFTVWNPVSEEEYQQYIQDNDCGLRFEQLDVNKFHLHLLNPVLINHLNEGFNKYKQLIKTNKVYKQRFMSRARLIHLENFN